MTDIAVQPAEESLPGLTSPPNNPDPNDQNSEIPTQPQTSAFEKLKSVTKGVFERHGVVFKRGGGRPRKDGGPNKLDIPINAPPTSIPAVAASTLAESGPTFDSALVKKCCSAVIKAFQGFFDRRLFKKSKEAGYDAIESKQLLVDCAITEKESDSFAELAEVCLRKYGVGTQYAPEIGLGCIAIGVAIRYNMAMRTLEEAIAEKKKNEPPIKNGN